MTAARRPTASPEPHRARPSPASPLRACSRGLRHGRNGPPAPGMGDAR
ncbi:hypothetical protein ACFPRL_18810 [Pseudoclavibacter helvolus]